MIAGPSQHVSAKIPLINGFRGLAIIAVIFEHLFGSRIDPSRYQILIGPLRLFPAFPLTNGFHGLTLFFILSGFVLSLPYMQGRRSMSSFADARSFYGRRLRRLGPLYVLCVLISMIFVYPHALLVGVPMMLTMTFSLHSDTFFPSYNGPLWSLAVEAAFSVVLPLVLIAVRRFGIQRIFLLSVVMCLAIRMASTFFGWIEPIANGLPGRLDDFMCGILLAHLYVNRTNAVPRFGFLVGTLLLVAAFQLSDFSNVILRHQMHLFTLRAVLFPLQFVLLKIGLIICIHALLSGRHRMITRCLQNWPLQLIGLMCYSLFVWHYILIAPLAAQSDTVHLIRYLGMLFLISAVTYRYVEFGSITDFRKLLPSPRTPRSSV